jgi:tripartite-type tricarboxylate transporter receptor subunit TctC
VPQVKAGKVKALAVTGSVRSSELPDTPSMAEEGYPGVDVHLWSGIFAPLGTPAPIVAKLEKSFDDAIHDPGVSAKLKAMAVDPGGGPADEFKRMIDADIIKYTEVVKAANLHFEE